MIGAAILGQAVVAGAVLLGLQLSPEAQLAIGVPVVVVAAVFALVAIRRLRSRQEGRRPERLQAVDELLSLELLTVQEAAELRSSIEAED